jgi:F-type H+-transporting ATPase subunit beta
VAAFAINSGTVDAVRGNIVDALFPQWIPSIYHILRGRDDDKVIIEVVSHLDAQTVRGIALTSTRGLARGSPITDTQDTLRVPVGEQVLGRVFNVFGETIDRKPSIKGGEWRSTHVPPVSLMRRVGRNRRLRTQVAVRSIPL